MSTTKTKVLICPYCGDTQTATERCRVCGGLFEPLSRQASHNAMGPWYVRDDKRPFNPGASYETIVKLIERGLINRYTILRSPTTKQFWTVARRVPGIAHLLGYCHNCDANVGKDDHGCPSCGVPFGAYLDRNYLGLPEVKPLPWEAPIIDEGRKTGAMRGFAPLTAGGESEVDFRRAAEPLGLSSFASDAELRGGPVQPMQATGGIATPIYEGATDNAPITNGEASSAREAYAEGGVAYPPGAASAPSSHVAAVPAMGLPLESATSVATRALNRRLQQQQQTIRLLMIGLGAVALLAAVIIIALIARGATDQTGANSGAPDANQKSAADSNAPAPAVQQQPPEVDVPATQPLEQQQPSATMPAGDIAPPASAIVEDFTEDLDRAAGLMTEAKKEDRALKDRIKDAEGAAAMLKSIKAKAAAAQRPADLDQRILEADRLVERLKLQEFFP